MYDAFRGLCERVLRIPPDPEPPPGDEKSARVFRAAPAYFKYRLVLWAIGSAFAVFFGVGLDRHVRLAHQERERFLGTTASRHRRRDGRRRGGRRDRLLRRCAGDDSGIRRWSDGGVDAFGDHHLQNVDLGWIRHRVAIKRDNTELVSGQRKGNEYFFHGHSFWVVFIFV